MSSTEDTARRELNNLRAFIRRPGLTGWVKDRSAAHSYERAFRAVVALEDEQGIEAAAPISDRLRALYMEARAAGLLTDAEIARAERSALRH